MDTNGHTPLCEDCVSLETAKLLKEKGFDEKCHMCWDEITKVIESADEYATNSELIATYISAPTLQMAMKWLRKVHHYYIQVMLDSWVREGRLGYYVILQRTDNDYEMMLQDALDKGFYETYEEACEAAIKYCLVNLI